MSAPDIDQLEKKTREIIFKQKTLADLTPRIIRQLLEKQLSLEKDALNSKEYKTLIKDATERAVAEREEDVEQDEDEESALEEIKPAPEQKNGKAEAKTKPQEDEVDNSEVEAKSAPTKGKNNKSTDKPKKRSRSASDEEDEEEPEERKSVVKGKNKRVAGKPNKKSRTRKDSDQEEEESKETEAEETKPAAKGKNQRTSAKLKKKPHSSDSEDEGDEGEYQESEAEEKKAAVRKKKQAPPKPKAKSESSVGKKRKSEGDEATSSKKKRVSEDAKKAYKSAEMVPPSSDFEDLIPAKNGLPSADEKTPRKASPKKRSSPVLSLKAKSKPASKSLPEGEADDAMKSESELSVLIDEPPKQKKKKGKSKEATSGAKEKKKKAAAPALSKDEDTIKKLKSLMVACGARKVWSRFFKDIEDSPSQQIKLLRKTLTDLGMTGRMSMEQAKAIKAKRELDSELAEVQAFERSVNQAKQEESEKEDANAESGSDEESNVRPTKRKSNARQSIMSFLEDQSESE